MDHLYLVILWQVMYMLSFCYYFLCIEWTIKRLSKQKITEQQRRRCWWSSVRKLDVIIRWLYSEIAHESFIAVICSHVWSLRICLGLLPEPKIIFQSFHCECVLVRQLVYSSVPFKLIKSAFKHSISIYRNKICSSYLKYITATWNP